MKKQRVKSQTSASSAERARAYAFFLLKFRLRSEAELMARLKLKGFTEALARETVEFLKDKKFIDDRLFAKGWVAARLKRPFGKRRIRQELIGKGLDKQIIEDSLGEAKEDYSESRIASQLAQQRFSKLAGIGPQKAKARVYAYLLRRGFSPDIVNDVLSQLK